MKLLAVTELTQFARDHLTSAGDLKKALSIALGIAIAQKLPLPPCEDGPVGASAHFAQVLSFQVCSQAAQVNEAVVVDIDLVEETARAFWIIRYHHAYPPEIIPLTSEDDGHFMNKLGGCGHQITPDTFAFCQANATAMVMLVNRIKPMLGC